MRSIELEGITHGAAPIPTAAVRGPLVLSGGIGGKDPATDAVAGTLDEEVAWLFRHVEAVVAAAGGTVDDIVKLTFYVRDRDVRARINPEWERMFPDPAARPARHTLLYEHLPAGMSLQCSLVAFVAPDSPTG